jgi:uncharacterized membrane protein YdjX (TVP38/TMEM64 family)
LLFSVFTLLFVSHFYFPSLLQFTIPVEYEESLLKQSQFSLFTSYNILFFQLGGGYLFGLPLGFVADSIGATVGAGAAFLLGRTVSFQVFDLQDFVKIIQSFSPLIDAES